MGISGSWTPIGPAAVDNTITWIPGTAPGGSPDNPASGRATVIAVNPANPDDVWLGTAGGGVWHATNVGASGEHINWRPMTDGIRSLAIGSILLEDCTTARCEKVWVGTGENNLRRDTYYGEGLYLLEWTCAFSSCGYTVRQMPGSKRRLEFSSVTKVLRGTPGTGLTDDLYLSIAGGRSATPAHALSEAPGPEDGYGVFRFSGGGPVVGVWNRMFATDDPVSDLEHHPTDNQRLFAGVYGQGVYVSSATDDSIWCPLNPGADDLDGCAVANTGLPNVLDTEGKPAFNHVEIATSPGSSVMYAMFGTCPLAAFTQCLSLLYRSEDGGQTWVSDSFGGDAQEGYSYYTHGLTIHPTDPNILYHQSIGIFRRQDPNSSFENLSYETIHADAHQVVVIPGATRSDDRLYAATDGGFYYMLDGDTGDWQSGNHNLLTIGTAGIGASHVVPVDGDLAQGSYVAIGMQDNGGAQFTGTRQWARLTPGDGGWVSVGRRNSYITGYNGTLFRFSAPGEVDDFSRQTLPLDDGRGFEQHASFHPAMDTNGRGLWAGTTSLYSRANGFDWVKRSPEFYFDDPISAHEGREGSYISAIGVFGQGDETAYVGMRTGEIWVNDSSGFCDDFSCWNQRTTPMTSERLPVASIDVDERDPDHAVVAYGGFTSSSGNTSYVFETHDRGQTWTDLSGGLAEDNPVNVVRFDPRDVDVIWMGSDRGLYIKTANRDWAKFDLNNSFPENVAVWDIAFDEENNRVFAGTHGRGVFMSAANPHITTVEGWTEDGIWDIPIYGVGFECGSGTCECTVEVLREDGTPCAPPSKKDADKTPADIYIDEVDTGSGTTGILATQNGSSWAGKPVVWACRSGKCVGGKTIGECNPAGNRVAAVRVVCDDNPPVIAPIAGECPQLVQPPSSEIRLVPDALRRSMPETRRVEIIPMIQASPANGGDRILCSAAAEFLTSDDQADIQAAIRDAINASSSCVSAGISAYFRQGTAPTEEGVDPVALDTSVRVQSSSDVGAQIVVGVYAVPGNADGLCFDVDDLGVVGLNQLAVLQYTLLTDAGGAHGGTLTMSEASPIGRCRKTVAIAPGDDPVAIATAIEDAFFDVSSTGLECPATANPRDVERDGESVLSILPSTVRVCIDDPGVGIAIGPHGIDVQCEGDVTAPVVDTTAVTVDVCLPAAQFVEIPAPNISDDCHLSLKRLDGQIVAIDGQSLSTPIDLVDLGVTVAPGTLTIRWEAEDASGNVGVGLQTVTVRVLEDPGLCCEGRTLVSGTPSNDTISPPSGPDYCVFALGGPDHVTCPGGDDLIFGASGTGHLGGGGGDDIVVGGNDVDHIHDAGGHLEAYGLGGGDSLIASQSDSAVLWGGAGGDQIIGSPGGDVIYPGSGADYVAAGQGPDEIVFLDNCELSPGKYVNGGSGFDTVYAPKTRAQMESMGLAFAGIESFIVDTSKTHLSHCFD